MEELEKELKSNQAETSAMEPDTSAYLDAIKSIKANSVSKEEYNKLKEERDELISNIVNGTASFKEEEEPEKEKVDINELRKSLFNADNSNLEYVEKAVKLRDALIENGEPDPFLPWGKRISPTQEDYEKAEQVVDVLKDCIEIADGNSDIFTRELQRRTADDVFTNIKKRK